MKFRAVTPEDAESCYALLYRAVHEGTGRFYTPMQQAAWAPIDPRDAANWPTRLTNGFSIAATKWGKIVGFFTMGTDGHIDFAYVAPEEMGRATARKLYNLCEIEARRLGLKEMTTDASHLAKRFFEKRGWDVTARQTVVRDGTAIDNFRMSKRL